MNFNPQYFDSSWLLLGSLIYGWALYVAIRHARWQHLRNATDVNILLYAMLGIFCLWLMNTDFADNRLLVGPTLHLLGATLLTMMFGWAFAIMAMSLVLLAYSIMTATSIETLYALPWTALAICVLPVLLSYRLFHLVDSKLPNNFFLYIFVSAFFGAALAMASVILTTTTIHYLSGAYSLDKLTYGYVPYGLILMFPEAFLTGMLMSIFVVYRPEWVSTFDDRRYLRKR